MLKKIQIKGLFDRFDYDIELKEGGLTILTGPNGYGKTTILRMIHAFATGNFVLLFQLPFSESLLIQDEGKTIHLKNEDDTLVIQTSKDKKHIQLRKKYIDKLQDRLFRNPRYRRLGKNHWVDRRTNVVYTTEDLINKSAEDDPQIQIQFDDNEPTPDFVDCYFIREQRLIKNISTIDRRSSRYFHDEEIVENSSNTIEKYAEELSGKIKGILAQASKIGQDLDSSFPERLFDQDESISKEDFDKRYDLVRKKRESLSRYGLSVTKEEKHTSFKAENAKALLVYLNDMEKKLAVFDEILHSLDLFSSILNKQGFVSKRIEISPEFGFQFKIEDDSELPLAALSSGEQQEVVLLYELLFRVAPNTLVLIDEPEISLHVAWQMEFLDDLLKIIELQKITVLVATHSPDIIDKHEDLVVDLWDLDTGSRENRE
uniref:Predicted ATP-binding protein involved in virulence n=1 Tax=Candidatus Kentrum sp. TC TaxID=2126339 RepID=A0A450YUQ4_9GAMM|nr:MAG: Predicted ATP-binding protein involved in virulence [Candidatus Kentron sp. TC]